MSEEYTKLAEEIYRINLTIANLIADITSVRNALMFHELKFHPLTEEESKDWKYIAKAGNDILCGGEG